MSALRRSESNSHTSHSLPICKVGKDLDTTTCRPYVKDCKPPTAWDKTTTKKSSSLQSQRASQLLTVALCPYAAAVKDVSTVSDNASQLHNYTTYTKRTSCVSRCRLPRLRVPEDKQQQLETLR
ncbi:unnamed protein product [Pleuronectes platessa]|uniref:Uncharacterized protein n=1 Tax=Pleuronectes platessa TaxID=8262 RepID=A0A9N7Z2A3_PLEPL|nr:unnamed protein product [Pleuronectes platessa]